MPRLLIAGCGYVGRATAELFCQTGWEVEGWTFSAESTDRLRNPRYAVRAIDISDAAQVTNAASRFDAVIQSVSSRGGNADAYERIYLAGAQNLRATFEESLLLFTSSTSVYPQSDGEWVTEMSAAQPKRETGRILREAEDVVLSGGGIVARLSGIYGPGRSALLRKFLAGDAVIDDARDRLVNHAHRDDIAAALHLLIERALAGADDPKLRAPRIFNVSDGHPIRQRDCYAWLAAKLQRPLPPAAETAAKRKRGDSNKRVSSEKLQALGWSPKYPTFEAAMTESILPSLDRSGA